MERIIELPIITSQEDRDFLMEDFIKKEIEQYTIREKNWMVNRETLYKQMADLRNQLMERKKIYDFHKEVAAIIEDNETAKSEWIRFCSFLRMAEPDVTNYSNIFDKKD